MGSESFDVVRFDLGPLLQGQARIDKLKSAFYFVNTSYPMDNCFTGRHDQSSQTPEKDVLYILLAGPVAQCALARWRIVLPSCLDVVAS